MLLIFLAPPTASLDAQASTSDENRGVLFATWDPWLQTGCREEEHSHEKTGYRVEYDAWFRVKQASQIDNGREIAVWTYAYSPAGVRQKAFHKNGQFLVESADYDREGRFVRLNQHYGMTQAQSSEEFVYGRDGRLMVIKGFKGRDLERVTEVRYHPSGVVFMHLVTNGGNAVIGRVIFETDEQGRVQEERHFLWGWLIKTVRNRYCVHGVLLSKEEISPNPAQRVRDPFYIEQKPSAP